MLLLVFLWWRSVEKKTNTKICYLLYKKYVLSPKGNTFSFFFTWQSKLQTFYIICSLWQLNIAFGDLNFEVSLAQLKTIAEVTISLTPQKKRKFHFTSSIVWPNCINNVMLIWVHMYNVILTEKYYFHVKGIHCMCTYKLNAKILQTPVLQQCVLIIVWSLDPDQQNIGLKTLKVSYSKS